MAKRGLGGVGVPRFYGRTPEGLSVGVPSTSGGLLLLLVGAYLLIAFFTGRLAWLTNALGDAFAVYRAGPSTPAGSPPATMYGPTPTWAPGTYPPPPSRRYGGAHA